MVTYDPAKSKTNFRKHGVRFPDCRVALHDPAGFTEEDWSEGEQRFLTLGRSATGMLVVVVWTERHHEVRIISARKASAGETRRYDKRD